MDSDCDKNKQENIGDNLPNDSDIPEPFGLRHVSLQTNAINERLLDYNVRALYLCVPILYFILCFL